MLDYLSERGKKWVRTLPPLGLGKEGSQRLQGNGTSRAGGNLLFA